MSPNQLTTPPPCADYTAGDTDGPGRRCGGGEPRAREGTLEIAGLKGRDDDRAEELTALAGLIVATIDGLSLQVAADPDGLDRDLAFRILADMVRGSLASRLET